MAKLILHNDKVNSFMKVKASLIRFCEYMPMQADQSVLIAHKNGKVTIKEGDFIEMLDLKHSLESLDLKVELIE
jgi:ATP-dependent Clp protease adapter protein ClpS